jgi:hypothetical protein
VSTHGFLLLPLLLLALLLFEPRAAAGPTANDHSLPSTSPRLFAAAAASPSGPFTDSSVLSVAGTAAALLKLLGGQVACT